MSFDYSKLATLKPKTATEPEPARQSESNRQPDSDRQVDSTRQSESSRPDSSWQVTEPANAPSATRQPKSSRQARSNRQPESSSQSDLDRQSESSRPQLEEGVEISSHFCAVLNSVVDRILPTLPPAAALTYLQLYRLAYGNKRNYCRIGHPKLAERAGLGESTMKRGLAVLEKRGLIEIVEYRFSGESRGTIYRLPVPPDTPEEAISRSKSDRQSNSSRQTESSRRSKLDPMKDRERHEEIAPAADAAAPSIYEIRVIGARLFERHRNDLGFDHERLAELVADALAAQGIAPNGELIEEAIKGMAG